MIRLGFDLNAMTAVTISEEPMDIAMHTMLARLRERHGDVWHPSAAGLGEETIARLRERALA